MRTILKGAEYYTASAPRRGDIAIKDGRIVAMAESIEPEAADRVIEVKGCYITPGLVDVHVHLREPGFEKKETIATGTAAAASGGYTTIFSMPNLWPAPDALDTLGVQLEAIERSAAINVIPYASITMGQKGCGELVDFEALAPKVGGFSDDGRGVQSDELMAEAMKMAAKVGRPIVAHCEVDELLRGGYIHDGDYCREHGHRGICSESEWAQVRRDVALVEQIGCQYHMCHASTEGSIEAIREAKSKGLRVSCETAPHYLLLTDADLEEDGRFKMNPPLRGKEDQLSLINGILDGTIEVIATDHAPHTREEKSSGLEKSAFGIVGIETAFPLLYTYLVRRGVISLERLIDLMSIAPRRIFGLDGGEIALGAKADLAVFDLNDEFIIKPSEFISKGISTPFYGWRACGSTVLTMVSGEVVYSNKRRKK
ncbi:MAG: dihydroorotase [Rikenellaceae bacterium]